MGYEVHFMLSGAAHYFVGEESVRLSAGEMLVIPPGVMHVSKNDSEDMSKYSLTFTQNEKRKDSGYIHTVIDERLTECFSVISDDLTLGGYRGLITDTRVYEIVVRMLLILGRRSSVKYETKEHLRDARLLLAKQYIRDNISRQVSVPEVASYCCISPKQLSRIFVVEEGVCVAEYIRRERCAEIERLLLESDKSLSEISEIMDFASEYYFNTFFKKNSGITPGAYRKTVKWQKTSSDLS